MMLEELLMENTDILQRMKEEDDRFAVRRLAHEYAVWGIAPAAEYHDTVMQYITAHPEEFRRVG